MIKPITSPQNNQCGFTLIEMTIVLVIIGLILGAITVGKDVVRNAEYQKVSNKFVYGWKKSYDEIFARTGVTLGDSQVAPTGMIDGNESTIGGQVAAIGNLNGAIAGLPENYTNTGLKICHGQGYPAGAVGLGDTKMAIQDLRVLMQKSGVGMPPGRGTGKEDRYLYTDSNGNPVELQICFQWNPPGTTSGAGNVMVIRGLTPDLARYLDQLIDGKPDALEGRFRQQNTTANTVGTNNQPGHEWVANNTYGYSVDNNTGTADQTGSNLDENRVMLVTAQWIMSQ